MQKKLHIWGQISDFKNWNKFGLPIKQTHQGFNYNGKDFNKKENCILFLNAKANRLVYVGNSTQAIDPIRRSLAGTYQIYIFDDNQIIYNGNEGEQLNDLNIIRESYFTTPKDTKYFTVYMTSNSELIDQNTLSIMDNHIEILAEKLNSNTQEYKKVNFYLYNNYTEMEYLSGMPFPWKMKGININNRAHSTSIDLKTINHEASHWFIAQKIGINNNQFYIEGFRQYTDYLLDSISYNKDLQITQSNINNLNTKLLKGGFNEFFSSPHNYPISGVFVNFLLEKVGLETFKKYYGSDSVNESILSELNISFPTPISEFKDSIL